MPFIVPLSPSASSAVNDIALFVPPREPFLAWAY